MRKNKITKLGISELLAITIGIAITVAVGVMLYMFMPNLMSSTTQQQKLGLVILSANALNDKSALVSIALRNLGTKAIGNINITILNQGVSISNILTPRTYNNINRNSVLLNLTDNLLNPGQEMTIVISVEGSPIISGTKINIIVIAKFIDETVSAASASTTIM